MPYILHGPYNVDVAAGREWQHYRLYSCNYPGPYQRGIDKYVSWSRGIDESSADLRVWKSSDFGVTWLSRDEGSMPIIYPEAVSTELIGADTVRMCYKETFPESYTPCVRDFDLNTDTLGPVLYNLYAYCPFPPAIGQYDYMYLGGFHRNAVAAEDRIFTVGKDRVSLEYRLMLFRHDDIGGFLPQIHVSDNVVAASTKRLAVEALYMDASGTSHVFYSESPRAPAVEAPRVVYYRQIDAAGAMTAPVTVYTYALESGQTFGFPAPLGTMLIVPFPAESGGNYIGSMLVIDPYTSPTPTVTQIDLPTQYLNLSFTAISGSVCASLLGSQMYLWWLEELGLDGITPLSRIMYTTFNGGAIPAPTVFHDEIANPSFLPNPGAPMAYLSPPYMDVVDPMLLVAMVLANGTYYWFSVLAPPPPPGAPFQPLTQSSRRMHVLIPNHFDQCLDRDYQLQQLIRPRKVCCSPLPYQDINWVRAPGNSIPFRKLGGIPTPLAAAGDVEVLSFQVPAGYDGLIAGLFNVYTGPGFLDGGGDIEWRLLINKVYAVHLGRVLVTLGSRQGPFPVEGGIQVQSGNRVQYIVSVPNLSGGILPLNSQIVCGLEGLFYARQ